MSLGSVVRRAFGPAEPAVARLYRGVFFDGASFGRQLRAWIDLPSPGTILEVGCGEGQMMEVLAGTFPHARLLGVDVHPAVGRLFRGDRSRVEFRRLPVDGVEGRFDLVVVCDVLHHVPPPERAAFMAAVGLRVGRALVVKDWERTRSPMHLLAWASDRLITQDRIRYGTGGELREHVLQAGVGPVLAEARIGPWGNNLALLSVRPGMRVAP